MKKDKIGLKEAMSIGIGGMVGGGIFAVLGLAATMGKGGTPVSFLVAGLIALITSYGYVKLSLTYPDTGGTVRFINEGFGKNLFSGGINNLLWVSYIIMLSLYASAFGAYAPNLLRLTDSNTMDMHIYATAIVLVATGINYYSLKIVGETESYVVVIKLLILIVFVFIGAYGLIGNPNLHQLSFEHWESPIKLIGAGMVIFVAYEGFELIANAAPNIVDPERNIPKAYYYSVGFVILLYVMIAAITVGSLPFSEIVTAQDYVLAEAAKPILGQAGFTIITIAALLSTFSAINASLYGGSRVSYEIAEDDELSHELTSKLWNQPIGLAITSIATLIVANTLNLNSISTTGSVGFLLIFAMVNFVAMKKSKAIKGNKIIPGLGFALTMVALAVLLIQQYTMNKTGVFVAIGVILFCFTIEFIYKEHEKRMGR